MALTFGSKIISVIWNLRCNLHTIRNHWVDILWFLIVTLSLSHLYYGSSVVLDCIDSWSLPSFLIRYKQMNLHYEPQASSVFRYNIWYWPGIRGHIRIVGPLLESTHYRQSMCEICTRSFKKWKRSWRCYNLRVIKHILVYVAFTFHSKVITVIYTPEGIIVTNSNIFCHIIKEETDWQMDRQIKDRPTRLIPI